jgi:hypothetical protein
MTPQEKAKLQAAKEQARKKAVEMNEKKAERSQSKNMNPWGYRSGNKGDEICVFLADKMNATNVKELKAFKWTSPYHWYVFKKLRKTDKLAKIDGKDLFYLKLSSKEEKDYIASVKKTAKKK